MRRVPFVHIVLLLAVGGCGLFTDNGSDPTLLPPFRGPGGLFGAAIAISDDYLIVGAPYRDNGRAYVFQNSDSRWELKEEFLRKGSIRYGSDVAISGRRLAVSSFLTGPSEIEIRTRDDRGAWQVDTLISAHRGLPSSHRLRAPLILDGDRLLARATGSGSPYPVATWRYRDGAWTETALVYPPDSSTTPIFGIASALCGERLYVAAQGSNTIAGAVYAYEASGDDWRFISRSPRYPGGTGSGFGRAIACNGNDVIVGAPGESYEDDGRSLSRAGAAYLYELQGEEWSVTRLVQSDPNIHDGFGRTVALDEHWIGIRSYQSNYRGGAVYMFRRTADEAIQVNKLTEIPPVRNHFFGDQITLSGELLAVTATGYDRERGAVYLFRLSGGNWVPY